MMHQLLHFESYTIKKVGVNKETKFIVMKGTDYQFTLVTGDGGFKLSAWDRRMHIQADQNLIDRISRYLLDLKG
jgi:hypothetical protein